MHRNVGFQAPWFLDREGRNYWELPELVNEQRELLLRLPNTLSVLLQRGGGNLRRTMCLTAGMRQEDTEESEAVGVIR
jgi:hypothetical protein